jgi:hypothetical protein
MLNDNHSDASEQKKPNFTEVGNYVHVKSNLNLQSYLWRSSSYLKKLKTKIKPEDSRSPWCDCSMYRFTHPNQNCFLRKHEVRVKWVKLTRVIGNTAFNQVFWMGRKMPSVLRQIWNGIHFCIQVTQWKETRRIDQYVMLIRYPLNFYINNKYSVTSTRLWFYYIIHRYLIHSQRSICRLILSTAYMLENKIQTTDIFHARSHVFLPKFLTAQVTHS